MKKFLTALLGLTLAGTMVFGLAACDTNKDPADIDKDPNGGTQSSPLLDAINATVDADNYKMSMVMEMTYAYLFNGELIAEDTVISVSGMEMTGGQFLQLISGNEEFENPVKQSQDGGTANFDFVNGKVSTVYLGAIDEETGEREEYTEYYEADGTAINKYYESNSWVWDEDTQEGEYVKINAQDSYTGYASNDKAKEVLKKEMLGDAEGPTVAYIMDIEVKGTGDNASKEGTIEELIDIFEYDEEAKTYSATVDASAVGEGDMYANTGISFTVEGGKVTEMGFTVTYAQDMSEMVEGLSVDMTMVATTKYSEYGAVSITVPAEYKQVDEENIHEHPVISSEGEWKALLADYDGKEFYLDYGVMETVDGELTSVNYGIYVDTEANVAMVDTRAYTMMGSGSYTRTYYKVENGKLLTYNGIYEDGSFEGYSEPVETTITGDATAALIAALPQVAKDYYAGFEGGALADLYSKFDHSALEELSADLKLNGKEVEVEVSYSYWNDKNNLSSIHVYYGVSDYFRVSNDASWALENYSPDNYNG